MGTARLVRANTKARLYKPTQALIEATYGPRVVLESLLSKIDGIEAAFIFGSWAARYAGEQGHAPNDIDVMVIGNISRRDLAELAEAAENILHMEVNIERISPEAWASQEDPFVKTLFRHPLIDVGPEKA